VGLGGGYQPLDGIWLRGTGFPACHFCVPQRSKQKTTGGKACSTLRSSASFFTGAAITVDGGAYAQ
jgi:hypothetical protein